MSENLIDKLEVIWQRIDDLCTPLTDEQWMLPTDCPGWSIKDHVAHISGSEALLLRYRDPFPASASVREIRAGITELNAQVIEQRRPWSTARLLEEFRNATHDRLAALRATPEEELEREVMSAAGRGTYRDFLGVRLFDIWVHEGDIRRALGQSMDLDGSIYAHSSRMVFAALPFVIARRAHAPDGAIIVFETSGQDPTIFAMQIRSGQGHALEAATSDRTVRIVLDLETFARLACGRIDPHVALASGTVSVQGDEALGRRVVEGMNFLF